MRRTFTALRLYDKKNECCLLVLQLCSSFKANACLMLAIITLYYFPSLEIAFLNLLLTLNKYYRLTIILIFLVFIIITISIFFFVTNVMITSVVIISVAFFYLCLLCLLLPHSSGRVLFKRQKHFVELIMLARMI